MKNRIIIFLCFFSICFIMMGCGASETVFLSEDNKDSSEEMPKETPENEKTKDVLTDENEVEESDEDNSTIVVYVCGAVNSPGVYEIAFGSRIVDAVNVAGGLSAQAQADGINLAQQISDGEQIRVPFIGEEVILQDSPDEKQTASGKININAATKEQLMTLSGVGESKADAIINYRDTVGKFKSVEEIMNIEGIKEGVFNKIKDNICI